jgi:hypothetical protein
LTVAPQTVVPVTRQPPLRRSPRRTAAFIALAAALALAVSLGGMLAVDVVLHGRFVKTGGVNVWGYRGPVLPRKAAGERRVVVVGGSSAFGYGVSWQEAIPARLDAKLNARGRGRYSVVNLAYNNEGAYSFRYTLEDYLYLDYDAAILYEGYNDLMGDPAAPNMSVFRRESPIFRLTGYLPILPIVFREKAAALLHGGDINQLYIESRTGKRVVFDASVADRVKAGALNAAASFGDAIDRELGTLSPHARPSIDTPAASGCRYPWAEYCQSVLNGVDFALAHGKRVLVVTQPYLLGQSRVRHRQQQEALVGALRRRYAARHEVEYFDAGPIVDVANPALSFDRMHLTAPGNDRVATALVSPVVDLLSSR